MWIFSVFVLIWNEEEEETGRWAAVKAFVEWCFLFLFSKRHNPVEDTKLRTLFHPNRIRFHFACISRTSIDTHLFGFAWLYSLFFSPLLFFPSLLVSSQICTIRLPFLSCVPFFVLICFDFMLMLQYASSNHEQRYISIYMHKFTVCV